MVLSLAIVLTPQVLMAAGVFLYVTKPRIAIAPAYKLNKILNLLLGLSKT